MTIIKTEFNRQKWILLFLFLTNFLNVNCQTIDKLDERNGFKTIELGSNLSNYNKAELVAVGEDLNANTIRYKYNTSNDDLKKVFNAKFDFIYLVFQDSKLVGIELRKTFTGTSHYQNALEELKSIISSFRLLFGKNTSSETEGLNKMGCIWAGNKVLLQAITSYIRVDLGTENKVDVYDIKFVDKKIKEGF